MTQVLFYVFAVTSIASAVLAISRKNAVASALWLVLMFFGLAGIYVLLEAYFVAAIQILVYAGAIMVLFLFVIMLLDLRSDELASLGPPRFKILGLIAAAVFLGLAVFVVSQAASAPPADVGGWRAVSQSDGAAVPDGGAGEIGKWLFNRWLLAFEVTSVLLLGAIVGAVVLTKRRLT